MTRMHAMKSRRDVLRLRCASVGFKFMARKGLRTGTAKFYSARRAEVASTSMLEGLRSKAAQLAKAEGLKLETGTARRGLRTGTAEFYSARRAEVAAGRKRQHAAYSKG